MGANLAAAVVVVTSLGAPVPPPPACRGEIATIVGTPEDDEIEGTIDRDVIAAFGGNDTVNGAAGDDLICGGPGYDVLSGDAGHDDLYSDADGGSLSGDDGNDALLGSEVYDGLNGGPGDDYLYGRRARDDLDGDGGDDVIQGGHGPDFVRGEGRGDVFGNDDYDGGLGRRDLFVVGITGLPGYVDLSENQVLSEGLDAIRNVEDVHAQFDVPNRIIGDDSDNWLVGGGDGDVIQGRAGDDVLDGDFWATDDTLTGGRGHDVFLPHLCVGEDVHFGGGLGHDTLDFSNQQCGSDFTRVDLARGTMETSGENGTVKAIENLVGSEGPDTFLGGPGPNRLWGKWGRDELYGRAGEDTLAGGHGPDRGHGGWGADVCFRVEERHSCERVGPVRRPPGHPI